MGDPLFVESSRSLASDCIGADDKNFPVAVRICRSPNRAVGQTWLTRIGYWSGYWSVGLWSGPASTHSPR
jgi:hypothetical protein